MTNDAQIQSAAQMVSTAHRKAVWFLEMATGSCVTFPKETQFNLLNEDIPSPNSFIRVLVSVEK